MGQTGSLTIRETSGANFADGTGTMVDGPNARYISNTLSQQTAALGNDRGLSSMVWQWGQFIDHDINLIHAGTTEYVPIVVPEGDPVFSTGSTIPFLRSEFTGGTSADDPRAYSNEITHWLDGSMVYGSDEERATALRSYSGGRLITGNDGYMPRNLGGLENDGGGVLDEADQFLAGDVRANEQAGLTTMHEVFFRYHNVWADRLSEEHSDWTDEEIYQTARKLVGATIQQITYEQWLPTLLGDDAMKRYRGYDPTIDSSISTAFSTAAFRFGHTMLTDELLRINSDGSTYGDGSLSLTSAFFNPDAIVGDGAIEALLRGLATQESNEIDTQAIEGVRSLLFGTPEAGGPDLIALNLTRGRDHGIADYNTLRLDFGLSTIESFDDITSDASLAAALEEVYGDVDSIDAWIGLMAEDHLEDASVGETLAAILADQFARLRDGDRFFYLNDEGVRHYLDEIDEISLADVISLTTDAQLAGDVFYTDGWTESSDDLVFASIPEPGTAVLFGLGLIMIKPRRRATTTG